MPPYYTRPGPARLASRPARRADQVSDGAAVWNRGHEDYSTCIDGLGRLSPKPFIVVYLRSSSTQMRQPKTRRRIQTEHDASYGTDRCLRSTIQCYSVRQFLAFVRNIRRIGVAMAERFPSWIAQPYDIDGNWCVQAVMLRVYYIILYIYIYIG